MPATYDSIDEVRIVLQDVLDSMETIEESYQDKVSELENEKDELQDKVDALQESYDELEDSVDYATCGSLEEFSEKILSHFGKTPNLGDVLSLKDDLKTLLITKYNIPEGAI